MQEENREGISGALKTLAAVVIVFLLLAALYVGYQAMQVLFPPNTYETALLATVEDTVDAEGVLLFEESYVAGQRLRTFGNFRKNDSDGAVRTGHCRCVPYADLEYRCGRPVLHGRLRCNLGAA